MTRKSIKFQVVTALLVQFVVLLSIVSMTIYQLNLRRHDYAILNLAGQLRVISQLMVRQSFNYVEHAPRDYQTYERDLSLYHKDLMEQVSSFDKIIEAFKARNLALALQNYPSNKPNKSGRENVVSSLINDTDLIKCNWDKPSIAQLDSTAQVWDKYKAGLVRELGTDVNGPRLEAAAKYILSKEEDLMLASTNLAAAFKRMMEGKLENINLLNKGSLVFSLLISFTILLLLYFKAFKPIDRTVAGFNRVAKGELDHQVPVDDSNEIGHLTTTFNKLTRRLSSLFQLTDRINQATNLDDTLKFVFEEFSGFLSIDWVGLLRANSNRDTGYLERIYTNSDINLHERDGFTVAGSLFNRALENAKPVYLNSLLEQIDVYRGDNLVKALADNNIQSVIFLPLSIKGEEEGVLVFASLLKDVYSEDQLELLENIAGQVSHSFEKTIGMESLVISAVEGLAKLAESRDPETGDHLLRMSMYSAILAEELGRQSEYQQMITPAYVRDVLRFAPMHDIGKVGIEDSILLKPGKLTPEERQLMEQHPIIGAQVLRRCEQQMNAVGHSIFTVGIEIAEAHHEKYDGKGYPYQLTGEAIPLSARIVAAADVFDALTSKRPYKKAWPVDKAMNFMREEASRHFDPEVISALGRALPQIMKIYDTHKHV